MRNFFYRKGLLKGFSFDIPVISVGNLSIGGAGKTPHIEYLIRLLQNYVEVATLSRGYKRKTKGYVQVQRQHNSEISGDEPLMFKRKFPQLMVAVSESRSFAIPQMIMERPNLQVVLLDDAFQHRSIKPGLNILLTEFNHPFTRDFLMPSGRLREWRSAYQRADVIIISKCPPQLPEGVRETFESEIKPFPHQQIFFSYYDYLNPYFIFQSKYQILLEEDVDVLLISAIARTDYLLEYLEEQVNSVQVLEYEDHHVFTKYDMSHLKQTFERMESDKKLILTTEKDAMRMELHKEYIMEHKLPIFALPVEVRFHGDDQAGFNERIKDFLLAFRA